MVPSRVRGAGVSLCGSCCGLRVADQAELVGVWAAQRSDSIPPAAPRCVSARLFLSLSPRATKQHLIKAALARASHLLSIGPARSRAGARITCTDCHTATHVRQVARAPGDVEHSGRSPQRFLQSESSVSDVTPPRKEADIVYQRVISVLLACC